MDKYKPHTQQTIKNKFDESASSLGQPNDLAAKLKDLGEPTNRFAKPKSVRIFRQPKEQDRSRYLLMVAAVTVFFIGFSFVFVNNSRNQTESANRGLEGSQNTNDGSNLSGQSDSSVLGEENKNSEPGDEPQDTPQVEKSFVPNNPSDDPNPVVNDPNDDGRLPVSENPIPINFPNPETTGYISAGLTESDLRLGQSISVTEEGTVVDGMNIQGSIVIEADNVTVRNSQITSEGLYVVRVRPGVTGLNIENTRIRSIGPKTSITVFLESFATLSNVHISGGNEILRAEAGLSLKDSYLVSPYNVSGQTQSVIGIRRGSDFTVTNNTLVSPILGNTPAVFVNTDSEINQLAITENYISGGNYSLRVNDLSGNTSDAVIAGNVFEKDTYKVDWILNQSDIETSDNTLR